MFLYDAVANPAESCFQAVLSLILLVHVFHVWDVSFHVPGVNLYILVMQTLRYMHLLLFLMGCAGCEAQLSGVVFDMETRRPVAGVRIFINPEGDAVTDRNGRFTINRRCSGVTLSHVSYESRALAGSELRDTVWLMPKMNRLDEVLITAERPKVRFDLKNETRRSVAGIKPAGGIGFDFFSIFDFKGKKQKNRRKRLEKILDGY